MKPATLTPAMARVLLSLHRYHYLMPYQFTRLDGFAPNVTAVHKVLARFPAERSEIAFVRSGVEAGKGRIPRLYYLTRHGAAAVAEMMQVELESVFYPKGDKLPVADVLHRAMTVDFWIELDRYAEATGGEVEFFHPYFRTSGANRGSEPEARLKKLTRIDFPPPVAKKHSKPFFWPDACFALKTPQKRLLCLLECYRGIDTGRVIRQLEWHLLALEHGLPSVKYGFETGNLVLLVFDGDTPMQAVMKRLLVRPDFDDFAGFIAFSTMQRLQAKFEDWWYVWQGEIRPGRLG
jgi:hypothetical protein